MFLHQAQLEHLLPTEAYFAPEQYQAERQNLFMPAWHVVATKQELAKPGDFVTRELLGQPILLRNFEGEIRGFLNVCAHRHAMLTHAARGNCEALRCQYHGWEYKADGYTAHIPEARIFRPMDREAARLSSIGVETCGNLVFANLAALNSPAPDSPTSTLADFLGPFYERCQAWFSDDFRLVKHWVTPAPANWKVLVENSLESYHVPLVHSSSFRVTPPEEICRHVLNERFSTFESDETLAWRQRGQTFLVRSLGLPVTNVYTHHLIHPHVQFVHTDVVRIVIMILPTSPTTCEQHVWVFGPGGTRSNPWAMLVRAILRRVVALETRRVLGEDATILADVQRGLEASRHRGVIGTREERVYAFQQYVMEKGRGKADVGRQV